MPRRVLILVLFVLLPASVAEAAVVTYGSSNCYEGSHFCTTFVTFRAATGEANDVVIDSRDREMVVHDRSTPLTAGRLCRPADAHTVVCPASDRLQMTLGDGDDRVAVPRQPIEVQAGPGDDVVTAGGGDDRIDGGAGADALDGGDGNDVLLGGPGRDLLEGGPGRDRVSYLGEPRVVVDLADPGADGPAAEADELRGVEDVTGSAFGDVLRGDGAGNALDGDKGDDVIEARAGGDELTGGDGRDRFDAGEGDDQIDAGDGAERSGEHVACGPGDDLVLEQRGDLLEHCERLELPLGVLAPEMDPHPAFSGRRARLGLRCPFRLSHGRRRVCEARVRLSIGGRSAGSRVVRFAGRRRPVSVLLASPPPTSRFDLGVTITYLRPRGASREQRTIAYRIRLDG